VKDVPNDERFAGFDAQQSYRTLVVLRRHHSAAVGETMAWIQAEAYGDPN
jgi:hypothetical protein